MSDAGCCVDIITRNISMLLEMPLNGFAIRQGQTLVIDVKSEEMYYAALGVVLELARLPPFASSPGEPPVFKLIQGIHADSHLNSIEVELSFHFDLNTVYPELLNAIHMIPVEIHDADWPSVFFAEDKSG